MKLLKLILKILIEYYIFQNDFLFDALRKLLYKKAAEGVEIRILYDALGSRHVKKKLWKELEAKGIKVGKFKAGFWNNFLAGISGVNYRNHRKIVVVDSYIGYVGGINIGKEYLGLGLGAASLISDVRSTNITDLQTYLEVGNQKEETKLSATDQMEEFMFLGLRLCSGISKVEFQERFATDYETVYGEVTQHLLQQGLLQEAGEYLSLTERGRDLSNRVLAEFLLD